MGRVITIWYEVFLKLRVYIYGLVTRKKVFSESSHCIETHLYVVLEVLEVHISVSFEYWLDKEFIEFWWVDIVFHIPHATNFCRLSTVRWWIPPDIRDRSGRVHSIWWVLMGWRGFRSVNMSRDWCDVWCEHWFDVFCEFHHFLIRFLLVGFGILFFVFNFVFHYE